MKVVGKFCAALALIAGLAACAGMAQDGQENSRSGVTVFGDIDVGVGRVR